MRPLKIGKHHQLICFHRQAGKNISNPLMSLVKRTSHGSACIASGSEEVAVSQLFLLPQKAPVNLLSRTQLFLLCIAPLWRG